MASFTRNGKQNAGRSKNCRCQLPWVYDEEQARPGSTKEPCRAHCEGVPSSFTKGGGEHPEALLLDRVNDLEQVITMWAVPNFLALGIEGGKEARGRWGRHE